MCIFQINIFKHLFLFLNKIKVSYLNSKISFLNKISILILNKICVYNFYFMDNTNNMSNTNIKQHIIIIIHFQENLYGKKM